MSGRSPTNSAFVRALPKCGHIIAYDKGANFYVGDKDTTLSNFQISGSAQISPGWSAGYTIAVEIAGISCSAGFVENQLAKSASLLLVEQYVGRVAEHDPKKGSQQPFWNDAGEPRAKQYARDRPAEQR
jgi:hypothetical protein